jgi:hypothetical protein
MADDLRALVGMMSRNIEPTFLQDGAIYRPIWHAVDAKGEHLILPPLPSKTKDEEAIMVRAFFELMDVVRYCVAMEAWTVERKIVGGDRAAVEALRRAGIANEPDRIEVIAFQAEDANEGLLFAQRRIIRPANKKPTLDALFVHPSFGEGSGRFVGMLPQRGTKQ